MKEFDEKFWDSINSLIDGKSGEDIAPPVKIPALPRPHSGAANLTYRFLNSGLQPPSQFYIEENTQLSISMVTSQTSEVVTVLAQVLMSNGRIQLVRKTLTTSTTTTGTENLPEGFLLTCSVIASVATLRAETYVRVNILNQTSDFLYTILAGYVTSSKGISFPPVYIEDSYSGNGKIISDDVAGEINPTSTYVWAYKNVPANRLWKIKGVYCYGGSSVDCLTEFAVFKTGYGFVVFPKDCPVIQTAAIDTYVIFENSNNSSIVDRTAIGDTYVSVHVPIPEVVMNGAENIYFYTTQLKNTSIFFSMFYTVEEWLTL